MCVMPGDWVSNDIISPGESLSSSHHEATRTEVEWRTSAPLQTDHMTMQHTIKALINNTGKILVINGVVDWITVSEVF